MAGKIQLLEKSINDKISTENNDIINELKQNITDLNKQNEITKQQAIDAFEQTLISHNNIQTELHHQLTVTNNTIKSSEIQLQDSINNYNNINITRL